MCIILFKWYTERYHQSNTVLTPCIRPARVTANIFWVISLMLSLRPSETVILPLNWIVGIWDGLAISVWPSILYNLRWLRLIWDGDCGLVWWTSRNGGVICLTNWWNKVYLDIWHLEQCFLIGVDGHCLIRLRWNERIQTVGLSGRWVWRWGLMNIRSIGSISWDGYRLREEPCTHPYARFCGQSRRQTSFFCLLWPDIADFRWFNLF